MARRKMRLGQMLLEGGFIDEFQLNSALSHQRNCGGGRLGSSLVKLKYITEEELLQFLAEQLGLPVIDPSRRKIPAEILACLPAEKAWEYKAIPLDRKEVNGTPFLLVAMADPTDMTAMEGVQFLTGCRVRPALAFESTVVEALVNHYGPMVTEEDVFVFDPGPEPPPGSPGTPAPRRRPATTEEKYQQLLKILLDKGILSLREFEKLK